MKKTVLKTGIIVTLMALTISMASACGKEDKTSEGPADSSLLSGENETTEAVTEEKTEAKSIEEVEVDTEEVVTIEDKAEPEADIAPAEEIVTEENVTDQEALAAVEYYCYKTNPDLEGIVKEGEYQVNWEIQSSSENEIVVLFRSYTGAEVRYYIDPVSGDTYVTEFVSGITESEQETGEKFNIRDYILQD